MLTLIICSKYPSTSKELIRNISETVGCEYEIVHIDNSQGQYSIFQAYNKGVSLSHGDVLCFMHEDLRFNTNGWGKKVGQYLQDTGIGLLGVAGVKAVPVKGDARMGGYFYNFILNRFYTLEMNPRSVVERRQAPLTGTLTECAVIDGVWFCMPKTIAEKVRFDEETYKGFHLYDLDISMQVQMTGRKVMICNDILIEHDSIGLFNRQFAHNLELFCEKWKNELPLQRGIELSQKQMKSFTEKAVSRLDSRIATDIHKTEILDRYKEENPVLSKEERKLVERSVLVYWRTRFRNADTPKEAKRVLGEFKKETDHSLSLKIEVLGKYFFYGLVHKHS